MALKTMPTELCRHIGAALRLSDDDTDTFTVRDLALAALSLVEHDAFPPNATCVLRSDPDLSAITIELARRCTWYY